MNISSLDFQTIRLLSQMQPWQWKHMQAIGLISKNANSVDDFLNMIFW